MSQNSKWFLNTQLVKFQSETPNFVLDTITMNHIPGEIVFVNLLRWFKLQSFTFIEIIHFSDLSL